MTVAVTLAENERPPSDFERVSHEWVEAAPPGWLSMGMQYLSHKYGTPKVLTVYDYENIHISLERRGLSTSPKRIVNAVKSLVEDLGQLMVPRVYADWDHLKQRYLPRTLAKMGLDVRHVYAKPKSNSADMRIADDLRSLIERPTWIPDSPDVIVIVTYDADFGPTVQTALARERKIIIVGISNQVSNRYKEWGCEIRYLRPEIFQ